jgi:dihydrolipoamide dehydrogenase
MNTFDLVVIGAGPAGYVAAIRASQLGMKVAVIDDRLWPGGTCLNVGCIPSKSLLHASELYEEMRHKAEPFGLLFEGARVNFERMQGYKENVIESLGKGVLSLFQKNRIEYIQAKAFIQGSNTVLAGEKVLTTDRILLACGSQPQEMAILPFDEKRVLSSTGALGLDHVPKSMIVIGAGVVGLELASVYRRLGTQVTVLEATDTVCPFLDHEFSHSLKSIMMEQGLDLHVKANVLEAQVNDYVSLEVELEGHKQRFEAEVVLVAIGRKPASQNLGLEALGVALDSRSRVIINDRFQSSVPSIFAVGDLVEGPMLAHKASEEAIVAVESIAGIDSCIHYASIPNVIYTYPEVAVVGFTEQEVKAARKDCLVGAYPIRFNSRSQCYGVSEGMVKIIADVQSHRILGVHILSAQASEMIGMGVICVRSGMTLEDLCKAPQAHPTISESIKEAALKALGRAIHQ